MNSLVQMQHLSRSLASCDGGQLVSIISGVEGSACPAGRPSWTPLCQHVTHLTVEVREGRQTIEDKVLDSFNGVPGDHMQKLCDMFFSCLLHSSNEEHGWVLNFVLICTVWCFEAVKLLTTDFLHVSQTDMKMFTLFFSLNSHSSNLYRKITSVL